MDARCLSVCCVALVISTFAGCGSDGDDPLAELKAAESFTLYSILGGPLSPDVNLKITDERFQNWRVIGKTEIASADARKEIVAALQPAVRPVAGGRLPACFDPRHAIRVPRSAGRSVDYLICFECGQIRKYGLISYTTLSTSNAPQKILNMQLRKANIPLDPSMKGE